MSQAVVARLGGPRIDGNPAAAKICQRLGRIVVSDQEDAAVEGAVAALDMVGRRRHQPDLSGERVS
jgi:hypothetical protein